MTTKKLEFNQSQFEKQIKNIPLKYDKNNQIKNEIKNHTLNKNVNKLKYENYFDMPKTTKDKITIEKNK